MREFELSNPNGIRGIILEGSDFSKDPVTLVREHHNLISILFIPEQYKEVYTQMNLYHKLVPLCTVNGVFIARVYFYSPSFEMLWE